MCKRCGVSMDHLLLHCPIACELWKMMFFFFIYLDSNGLCQRGLSICSQLDRDLSEGIKI